MLHYILSSREYSHFSEQMPIKRAWCQAYHLQDVLCSSITNRRLMDAAALSPLEEALQTPFNTHPPISVKIPWHLVEKNNIVFDLQLTGFTNNDKETD